MSGPAELLLALEDALLALDELDEVLLLEALLLTLLLTLEELLALDELDALLLEALLLVLLALEDALLALDELLDLLLELLPLDALLLDEEVAPLAAGEASSLAEPPEHPTSRNMHSHVRKPALTDVPYRGRIME